MHKNTKTKKRRPETKDTDGDHSVRMTPHHKCSCSNFGDYQKVRGLDGSYAKSENEKAQGPIRHLKNIKRNIKSIPKHTRSQCNDFTMSVMCACLLFVINTRATEFCKS